MQSKARVLVVEDRDDLREMLGGLLEVLGATVLLTSTVEEALTQVEAFYPDIILSDLNLPDVGARELARRLQQYDRRPQMLLVAMTCSSAPSDQERAQRGGFDKVLLEPLSPETLEGLIRLAVARFR